MTTITESEIRWQDFCDDETSRFAFDVPRIVGGWKIATNSRVAIAVPTDETDSPPTEKRWPNVSAILAPVIEHIGDVKPLPVVSPCQCVVYPGENEKITCPKCEGKTIVECKTCNGTGEDECPHCEQIMDCDDCDGQGKYKCEECDGGIVTREKIAEQKCNCVVILGRRAIASVLFDKIARLPDVGYYAPKGKHYVDQLWFRFAGDGVGVVMQIPTTPETKQRQPIL